MGESHPVTPVIQPPIHYDSPVVVTGGAGLLGRDVVRQLAEGGCRDVRVVDLQAPPGAGGGAVRHHPMDIRRDDLLPAFAGARTVLHLAACQYHSPLAPTTYRLPFFAINVEGTRRALDAARRAAVGAFVHVSTSMVYGLPREVPLREDHPRRPLGPYGRSKLEAERLVEAAHAPGLRTVIVRPPPLYGPGRTGVVTRLFDRILAGRPVTLIGSGRNRQELAAPEDCARLVLLAGQGGEEQAVYNCGSASVPTMREWISALIADAGSRSVIRTVPAGLMTAGLRLLELAHRSPLRREQYAIAHRDYYLDTAAARERLGWVPRSGGVDAALALFRWYRVTRGRAPGA
ncbi:MAG: NAD(P)-dependent oxidoreductase [Candidatus Eisenbacteria bacterium]